MVLWTHSLSTWSGTNVCSDSTIGRVVNLFGQAIWGTNGDYLKRDLGQVCDGSQHGEHHQHVMGSNSFGLRSVQKATWPKEMCKKILKSILKEYDARTCAVAFPAETEVEIAEER